MTPLRAALVVALVAAAAGCGGTSAKTKGGLADSCSRERAALARIGPIETLGDARDALRAVLASERRALAAAAKAGPGGDALAGRLRRAIATVQLSLASLESDPERTMDPIRTGAPAERRAAATAQALVRDLCRLARG